MDPPIEIRTIYWVTHPTYALSHGVLDQKYNESRYSAAETERYFVESVYPLIEKTVHDPHALMVLVRQAKPSQNDLKKMRLDGMSPAAMRKALALERKLATLISSKLPKRSLVFSSWDPSFVARSVHQAFVSQNWRLNPETRIFGYGAYRHTCVHDYPTAFYRMAGIKKRIRFPRRGSISARPFESIANWDPPKKRFRPFTPGRVRK